MSGAQVSAEHIQQTARDLIARWLIPILRDQGVEMLAGHIAFQEGRKDRVTALDRDLAAQWLLGELGEFLRDGTSIDDLTTEAAQRWWEQHT